MKATSFADVYEQVQRFIQTNEDSVLKVIKDQVNREYARIAYSNNWPELRGILNEAIQTVSGQQYLALPADVASIESISNKAQDIVYRDRSLSTLVRDNLATFGNGGTPYYYSILGLKATLRPLSQADKLRVVPSATLGNEISIKSHGLRSSPEIPEYDQFTTNGISAVSGTVTYRQGWSVDSIGTDGVVSSYISIVEDATPATILAHIPKGEKQSLYTIILFENTPGSADDLTVVYKKRVPPLVDDDDVLLFPDVAPAIIEAVIGKMRQYDRKYEQADRHMRDSEREQAAILAERRVQGATIRQFRPPPRWERGMRRGY